MTNPYCFLLWQFVKLPGMPLQYRRPLMCYHKSKAYRCGKCLIRYIPNTDAFSWSGLGKWLELDVQYCLVSTGTYQGTVTILAVYTLLLHSDEWYFAHIFISIWSPWHKEVWGYPWRRIKCSDVINNYPVRSEYEELSLSSVLCIFYYHHGIYICGGVYPRFMAQFYQVQDFKN